LQLKGEGEQGEAKEVSVEAGTIAYAAFGLTSPFDTSGQSPVGTLVLQSVHGISGEAFIDNSNVGRVEKDSQLTVSNLTAGSHEYRIGDTHQETRGVVMIRPNETTFTVLAPPSPPTGLTATIQ
jgi:hypothetical protein